MAKQNVAVELYYDGDWQTVTSETYTRDEIRITRGSGNESGPAPAAANATFQDADRYNPRNPTSDLFGKISRNTPLRVSVGASTRLCGEVASWRPRKAIKGDSWTDVEVAGVTQRLGQGAYTFESAIRRAILADDPHQYWPLEDAQDTTHAENAVVGGPPMVVSGQVKMAGIDLDNPPDPFTNTRGVQYGSGPQPDLLNGGRLTASFPPSSSSTWAVQFRYLGLPHADFSPLVLAKWSAGTDEWTVEHSASTFLITVRRNGSAVLTSSATVAAADLMIAAEQDGSDINLSFNKGIGESSDTATVVGATLGGITGITINPDNVDAIDSSGGEHAYSIGHVRIWNTASPSMPDYSSALSAWRGYSGETAARRVERLCGEEDITFSSTGDLDDSEAMGPQRPGLTFLEQVDECRQVDGGILSELTDQIGLHYRTGRSLYNQAPVLTLGYTAGGIAPPLDPDVDDLGTRNDVTVRREGGSSYRAVLATGALSVQAPPNGVGRTVEDVTLNVRSDGQLERHAGWRLHLGTVDEMRWPRVTVDLDARPDLASDVSAVELGEIIEIEDVVADPVRILVQQITESIGSHRRTITFSGTPASAYQVVELDDDELAFLSSGASTLAADFEAGTDTSMTVAVGAGYPPWITGSGGAGSVTYVDVSTDDSGTATQTSFDPGWPAGYTPTDGDDGILFLHFGGNSITATDPSGWTDWPGVTNPVTQSTNSRAYAWYRRITSADSPPSIAVSGSATGIATLVIVRGGLAAGGGAQVGQNGSNSGSGTSIDLPTLTGVADGSMIVAFVSARVPSGTNIPTGITPDADYDERSDVATSRTVGTSQNVRQSAHTRDVPTGGTFSGDTFSTNETSSLIAFALEVLAEPAGFAEGFPFDVMAGGVRLTVTAAGAGGELVLNDNPYFETNAADWFAAGGTVARSTAQAHEGSASLLLTPDGVTATARAQITTFEPVIELTDYTLTVWVRCASSRNVVIDLAWYDSDQVFTTTSSTDTTAVTANTWTELTATWTAPADTGFVRPRIYMTGTPPASDLLYIDEAELTGEHVQVFTVTQAPVNGVEKTVPSGTEVDIYPAAYVGL